MAIEQLNIHICRNQANSFLADILHHVRMNLDELLLLQYNKYAFVFVKYLLHFLVSILSAHAICMTNSFCPMCRRCTQS
jgi:hypothetical protein